MAEHPEIATLGDCITYLGVGGTISDADRMLLRMIKSRVENAARKYCRHNITQPDTEYTHLLPISRQHAVDHSLLEISGDRAYFYGKFNGTDMLQLPQPYVRSITSLYEDRDAHAGASGDFPASTLLTEDTDYYVDWDETGLSRSGMIFRDAGNWSTEPRTIQVTYNAGFTASELDGEYLDVRFAIIEETVNQFNVAKSKQGIDGAPGPIRSERIGRYAVTYDTNDISMQHGLSPQALDRLEPYVFMGLLS